MMCHLAVEDWQPIRQQLLDVINDLPKRPHNVDKTELNETVEFLEWLASDNFTLMGYRQLNLSQ